VVEEEPEEILSESTKPEKVSEAENDDCKSPIEDKLVPMLQKLSFFVCKEEENKLECLYFISTLKASQISPNSAKYIPIV